MKGGRRKEGGERELEAHLTSLLLLLLLPSPPSFPLSPDFDKPPYAVTETGWGEFPVNIKITFVAEAQDKPLSIVHHLKLHHFLPTTTTVPAVAAGVEETPVPVGGEGGDVKMEVDAVSLSLGLGRQAGEERRSS